MTAMRFANGFQRGAPVTFTVDGATVQACRGETLAAALLAAGLSRLRHSPREGGARGAFCFMGVCQECLVRVDGVLRQACQTQAEDGLTVVLRGSL